LGLASRSGRALEIGPSFGLDSGQDLVHGRSAVK
jgi:hypothetical protein